MSDIKDLVRLDDRLRYFGVPVHEVAGWETRGHGAPGDGYTPFTPIMGGNHHTGGGPNGPTPSLDIIINGRGGSLPVPGPLANVLQGRDDVAYVVAAFKANHGGQGVWRGRSGNSLAYGLEIEHTGGPNEPFGPHRFDIAARIQAAFAFGRYDSSWIWQHRQYATPPGRKVDFIHALINDQAFLDRIQWYLDHPPTGTIVKPNKPQPRLVKTLRVGDVDKPDNPIIERVENLIKWNAVRRGHPSQGPGRVDGKFTGENGTAEGLVYFRRWFYDVETMLGHTPSQRLFKEREYPGVAKGDFSKVACGIKTYNGLVFAAAA